jgi:hypothetical protein
MRRQTILSLIALVATLVLGVTPGAFARGDRSRAVRSITFVFKAHASGAVAQLLLHVDRASKARSIVVALDRNANGRPGARLSTGALTAPRRGAWNTVSLAPARLVGGRRYWLSVAGHHGALRASSSRSRRCAGMSGTRLGSSPLTSRTSIGDVRARHGCPVFAYVILESSPPPGAGLASPLSPATSTALAAASAPLLPSTSLPATHPIQPPPEREAEGEPPLVEKEPPEKKPVEKEPPEEPPVEKGPQVPADVSPPVITGSAVEGQTVKVTIGTWTGSPTSFAYKWQDCNAQGASCTSIAGATSSSYKLKASDVAHTVRAVVTASNAAGSSSANSGLTALVSAPSSGEALFISPSGKDSSPCSEAQPCLTMGHAYEKASAGQTVQMLAGSYPGQTISGAAKATSAHVVFAPAPGASVTVSSTIYVFASHVTIEGITVKDVTTGNYDQTPGRPNPTDVSLLNLTGRNFEIDSATNVTVEGGSWGPASACGGPYGGNNNSIRQTIPAVTPENIMINNTIIHDVQSYDLIECHIEGLAIFAGNHVTVSNSKFYGNSIYDVFIQANSGGKPNNVTIAKNWMANAVDNSGANGHPAGYANGIVLGSEISSNLTLSANHLNGVVNINDDGSISSYTNTSVLENFASMPYSGYPCASALKGVSWSKNVWQNDKCGASDVNLQGAALPYVKASNDSSLDYTLTGAYANWPAEGGGGGGGGGGEPSGTLYLSPSGSDAGSCTQGAPCKTLARAYALAQGGETVKLAAGTYTDSSLPLTSGKTSAAPVVFEPVSGAAVKFSKLLTVQAHGVELKGFTFERELFFGENAEGDVARNNALHNFEIIANGTKAPKNISIIGGTAGPVADSSDNENNLIATNGPETTAVPSKITIEGVLIHEYTKVGSAHVDCLQIWAGNELTIQGNTFKKCAVFDIFLQSLPNGSAGTPKNVTIQNNFLEKTIEGFYSIFLPRHNEGNPEHFENVEIRNNSATQAISADPRATYTNVKLNANIAPSLVFWNEATEVNQATPAGAEADYNVLYGPGAKKLGSHDQTAPAGFVNEGALNLHLTEGAAAIGHGDPSDFPATDIDGNARANPPDAGAAQFGG